MDETPLEDGRTAVYDSAGNLTLIRNPDGTTFSPDTSIIGDLARQFAGRVGDAINRAFAVRTSVPVATNSPAPAPAQRSKQQGLMLLALAGLAAFVYLRRKGA